jgi:uncharacterized protein YjiS (DUF1127 family)/GNAT superfamily N-acetyltransferase
MFKLTDPLIEFEKSTNVRLTKGIFSGLRVTVTLIKNALAVWRQRSRTRRELAKFDARALADAGISTTMADFEAAQPFWKEHSALGKDPQPEVTSPRSAPPLESAAMALARYVTAHTKDGTAIWIRPLAASDRSHILDLFETSSPQSRYARFLRPVRSLSESELDRLSKPDGLTHLAWLAFEPAADHLRCVGVARIARTSIESDKWEFSVSVRDEDHGHGIGAVLLGHVGAEAEKRGIHTLHGHVLIQNRPMVDYAKHRGAQFALDYPGIYRFQLPSSAMAGRMAKAA